MKQLVKKFMKENRFRIGVMSKDIGLDRHRVHRRLTGINAWTAPEVVRFHGYLESEGVTIDLGELTRMCAADHRGE